MGRAIEGGGERKRERARVGDNREWDGAGRKAYRAETNDGQQNTAARSTRVGETCGSLCEQLNWKSSAALRSNRSPSPPIGSVG